MSIVVHTDGGARGNPGPAAIGVVIQKGSDTKNISHYLGAATNNVAEYSAVIEALKVVNQMTEVGESVQFYLDSLLVVNQINGVYKIKDSTLQELFATVKHFLSENRGAVRFTYVPREQNSDADRLVNIALDEALRK